MNNRNRIILIVCTGNRCRSPVAEGIMKQILKKYHKKKVDVHSAGTQVLARMPATLNARVVCLENGIDIDKHQTKQITETMVRKADLILVMEKIQKHYIENILPESKNKILFLNQLSDPSMEIEIPDPVGQDLDAFRMCFNDIYQYLYQGLDVIQKQF